MLHLHKRFWEKILKMVKARPTGKGGPGGPRTAKFHSRRKKLSWHRAASGVARRRGREDLALPREEDEPPKWQTIRRPEGRSAAGKFPLSGSLSLAEGFLSRHFSLSTPFPTPAFLP